MSYASAIIPRPYIIGADIKIKRLKRGLTQTALGQLVGCSRYTIARMEGQSQINARWGLPSRIAQELGLLIYNTSTRARVGEVLPESPKITLSPDRQQERLDRVNAKVKAMAANFRQPCEAMTRKGTPCRNLSEPGKRRCKFHGGMSTGPKTPEGKARIAEAQRQRWAKYRAQKSLKNNQRKSNEEGE